MTKMTLLEKAKEMGVGIRSSEYGEWVATCPSVLGIGSDDKCSFISCIECYAREYDPDWDKDEADTTAAKTPTEKYFDMIQKNKNMTRRDILESAIQCVCADRESQYGSPENNFASIARLWRDYFIAKGQNICISSVDVAVMMALLKIARIATGNFKADSYIDAAGYIACAAELETGGNTNAN